MSLRSQYKDPVNECHIVILANNFLEKLSYYASVHEHVKHAHCNYYSAKCDYIKKPTNRRMTWCENKCALASKTFKPFPLKDMAAFVHMASTRKYHVHDLHVKEPGIFIKSIGDANKFLKMISKPVRQLCSCKVCDKEILSPHYCRICQDFETSENPGGLSAKSKSHIDSISYLRDNGKFVENYDLDPLRYESFNQFMHISPYYHLRNCGGDGDDCKSISCDKYMERFPSLNRYSDVKLIHIK